MATLKTPWAFSGLVTEKVLEVYKQFNGDNNVNGWKVSMIGNDGNVFYEEDYKGGVA